ncbi:MAG: TolC family protein [Betaproteobacteria bacterium]|nr:TolC family protein [Betaproteobacteria bacterium]
MTDSPFVVGAKPFKTVLDFIRPAALIGLAVLTTLAGCASYRPQPVDLTKQAQRLEMRRLDDPGLARYAAQLGRLPWPPPHWNRADLLVAALYYNPSLAVARARLLVANAGEITAHEYPNPTLGLTLEYAKDAGTNPWLYGVAIQALLPQFDLRRARQIQAGFYNEAAGWSLAEAVWQVRSRLRNALLRLRYADAAGAVLARQDEDARSMSRLLAAQVNAGEASAPLVQTAQAQALRIQQQLDAMRAHAMAARHALAAAIGIPAQALPALGAIWSRWQHPVPVSPQELDRLSRRALLTRADLAIAVANYGAAEQALRIEVDKQYPGVTVGPGYSTLEGGVRLPFSIHLALPIFNQNQGPIAQAQARLAEAGAQLEAVQANILAHIAAARVAAHQAAIAAGRAREQQLPLARQQLRTARQGFDLGNLDHVALLTARLNAEGAELASLQSDFNWQMARGALEDALHRPLGGSEVALGRILTKPLAPDESR